MNLTPHLQEKDMDQLRTEQVQKKKNEFHLIGQERRIKGHTLFCFNFVKREIKIAPMNQEIVMGLDGSVIYKNNVTLPFYWGNYDPSNRESWFIEVCIREYMERLGYELILWDYKSPYKNGHYVIKGVWGEVVSDWAIEVDHDKSTGSIYKFLGDFQWVENKFDGLDNAIGAINTMLIPECLRTGGAMTSVLQKMTTDRAGSISLRSVQGFNVHVEDQKQKLIEKLEEELKRLKRE